MDDACKSILPTRGNTDHHADADQFPKQQNTDRVDCPAINLSYNARNAEMMAKEGGLKKLFHRVLRHRDVLLMKVLRNISQHTYDKACESGKNNNNSSGSGQREREKMRTMTAVEAVEENPVKTLKTKLIRLGISCCGSVRVVQAVCN